MSDVVLPKADERTGVSILDRQRENAVADLRIFDNPFGLDPRAKRGTESG